MAGVCAINSAQALQIELEKVKHRTSYRQSFPQPSQPRAFVGYCDPLLHYWRGIGVRAVGLAVREQRSFAGPQQREHVLECVCLHIHAEWHVRDCVGRWSARRVRW